MTDLELEVDRPGARAPSGGLIARCAAGAIGRRISGRRRPGRATALTRAALRSRFTALAAATPDALRELRFVARDRPQL